MEFGFLEPLLSLSPSNPIFIIGVIFCVAASLAATTTRTNVEDVESDIQIKKEVETIKRLPFSRVLNPWFLLKQLGSLFKNLPHKAVQNFISAFYIISYRPEWGKYKRYDESISAIKKKYVKKRHICHKKCPKFCPRKRRGSKPCKHQKYLRTREKIVHEDDLDHNHKECEQITINVSGLRIITQKRTLNRFPDTLLGNRTKRLPFYDPATREYFFDRNRKSFEAIMYYYQSGGVLKKPYGIPADVFMAEVRFFQLAEALSKLKSIETVTDDVPVDLPKHLLAKKMWLLFEHPHSSAQAQIVSIISIATIGLSIITFCAETVREFAYSTEDDVTLITAKAEDGFEGDDDEIFSDIYDPFFILETSSISWFIFEFLMRLFSCANFRDFFGNFMNLVDLIAIFPYFLSLILQNSPRSLEENGENTGENSLGQLTAILKVARLVRIFKLSRHFFGLKVLGRTLRASIRELFLLILFLLIGVIFFSSAMYFAEDLEEKTPFTSIPAGFWWAIITMTTVGYGDMVPIGIYGKIVGSCCSVAGVLTIALPVPVIVSNFNRFYKSHAKTIAKKDEFVYVENCPHRFKPYGETRPVENEMPASGHKVIRDRYCSTSSESDFEPLKFATRFPKKAYKK